MNVRTPWGYILFQAGLALTGLVAWPVVKAKRALRRWL